MPWRVGHHIPLWRQAQGGGKGDLSGSVWEGKALARPFILTPPRPPFG